MDDLQLLLKTIDNLREAENCSKSKVYLRQWITSLNFCLPIMLIGMAHGHTAILLQQLDPKVMNASEKIRIENGEIIGMPTIVVASNVFQTWIASVLVLFNSPGCWILIICSRILGRKPVLIMAVTGFAFAWLQIAFAKDAYIIIVARAIMGCSIGILAGLTSIYQGECSMPKLRPTFNAIQSLAFSIGIMTCHIIGTWFHWRTTALFCGIVAIITLGLNCFIPESPVWLLHKKRYIESIHSWIFLRGSRDFGELTAMLTQSNSTTQDELSEMRSQKNRYTSVKKYYTPAFLKPFGVLIALFTTAQLSGVGAVTMYCLQIVTNIAGAEYAYVPTLILDGFRLLASIGLSLSIRRFSARTIVLFSSFTCSFFLILLSLTILFNVWVPWVPLICLFFYEGSVISGLSPLPFSFLSELFSNTHKNVGVGLITSYYYFLFFTVVKMNSHFIDALATSGTFFLYGLLTLIGSCVLYSVVPETKNKTLKEIELIFSSDHKRKIIKK